MKLPEPEPVAWDEHGEPYEWVLSRDENGRPTGMAYRELPEQQARRHAEALSRLPAMSPGVVDTLRRAQRRARKAGAI